MTKEQWARLPTEYPALAEQARQPARELKEQGMFGEFIFWESGVASEPNADKVIFRRVWE